MKASPSTYLKNASIAAILFSLIVFSASTHFLLPGVSATSGNVPISNSGLKKVNSFFAGYVLSQNLQKSGTLQLQSKWNIPSASCNSHDQIIFDIWIVYSHQPDDGSELRINCASSTTPVFSLVYSVGSHGFFSLPTTDLIAAGDKMQTILSQSISTGVGAITIKDFTQGWTFSTTMSEAPGGLFTPSLEWEVTGGGSPLVFFTNIKTTGDFLSLGTHHGSIGSFLSVPSVTVTQYTDVNATGHVDARATPISSTSSGFTIKWLIA